MAASSPKIPRLAGRLITYGCVPRPGAGGRRPLDGKRFGLSGHYPMGRNPRGTGVRRPFQRHERARSHSRLRRAGRTAGGHGRRARADVRRPRPPGTHRRSARPAVFVDYAHTEEALRNVLQTLRETSAGRLVCLFGCGGNRDRSKRPQMGAGAAGSPTTPSSPATIPATRNPARSSRKSWPASTRDKPHARRARPRARDPRALRPRPGDTVLIAGKGHETYQEIAGRMTHFDDREVVRAALAEGL